MAAAKHGFPDGHEIGHGVVAIADELGRVRSRSSINSIDCVGEFGTIGSGLTYLVEHRRDQGLVWGVSAPVLSYGI